MTDDERMREHDDLIRRLVDSYRELGAVNRSEEKDLPAQARVAAILDDPEAMGLFKRAYRKPWVVEDVV